jgi:hypothetical protein
MPVHSLTHASTAAAASAARRQTAEKADAHKFAGALAQASSKSSANTPDSVLDSKKVPKGEKTEAVKGHAYADITAGPRNGMFLNTSGNKRDGQAFVLVKRDGKEFHIYGSGKDRLVVCLKRKDPVDDTASAKAKAKTETTAPATDTAPSGTTGAS